MALSVLSVIAGLSFAAISLSMLPSTIDPDLRVKYWYGAALGLLCAGIGLVNLIM